jgi:anti-sigma factor RsiW
MEHREISPKLGAFLDNELAENVRAEVDSHIKSCHECSLELAKLASQQAYLRQAKELEVPFNFRAKITGKIETNKPKTGVFNIGKLLPIPMALSLLILIFSVYMVLAPVAYAMGDGTAAAQSKSMAANAVITCFTGSIFAPAAFARFCDTCNMNACTCCKMKCGNKCKMGGK